MHGIASPSRRPTIFDVFRPSARKGRERDAAKLSGSSDKDNISTSSNQSGGHHTSLVQSVKQVVQQAVAGGSSHHNSSGSSGSQKTSASKYKDGSAHPHAGSDAQVSSGPCLGEMIFKVIIMN